MRKQQEQITFVVHFVACLLLLVYFAKPAW
jgi:hypothetical protein